LIQSDSSVMPALSTVRGCMGGIDVASVRAARTAIIERAAGLVPPTAMMRAPAIPSVSTGTTSQALVLASGVV
jgi:hypothetical protein